MPTQPKPRPIQERIFKATSTTYDPLDHIFTRYIAGEFASISNSWPGNYGDCSLENLDKAQLAKFRNYFEKCEIQKGDYVLDVGSGFGPVLHLFQKWGARVIGLCPSQKNYEYLKSNNFEVYHDIWQTYVPEHKFKAILCIGSPEHYCSIQDFVDGKQDLIYRTFFEFAHRNLVPGGFIAGQAMTWNGKVPDPEKFDFDSKDPMYYHLARLSSFYPEAWLPKDIEHFYSCAPKDYFEVVDVIDGREHYIWTMNCWNKKRRLIFPISKWYYIVKTFIQKRKEKNFKYYLEALLKQSNKECFINGWMGHEFFFLKKSY